MKPATTAATATVRRFADARGDRWRRRRYEDAVNALRGSKASKSRRCSKRSMARSGDSFRRTRQRAGRGRGGGGHFRASVSPIPGRSPGDRRRRRRADRRRALAAYDDLRRGRVRSCSAAPHRGCSRRAFPKATFTRIGYGMMTWRRVRDRGRLRSARSASRRRDLTFGVYRRDRRVAQNSVSTFRNERARVRQRLQTAGPTSAHRRALASDLFGRTRS